MPKPNRLEEGFYPSTEEELSRSGFIDAESERRSLFEGIRVNGATVWQLLVELFGLVSQEPDADQTT